MLGLGEPAFRWLRLRKGSTPAAFGDCQRVLVIRLDEIGDLALFSPFLREFRRSFPRMRVSLVVKPLVRDLMRDCPYIDELLLFDPRPRDWPIEPIGLHLRAVCFAARRLWPRRFDAAIVPRRGHDYYYANQIAYLSGAGQRIGHRASEASSSSSLLTKIVDVVPVAHEVTQNLNFLRALGGEARDDSLELWPSKEDRAFAVRLLNDHGITRGESPVALFPGASARHKVWPVDFFRDLSYRLYHLMGLRTVVIGGQAEVEAARAICREGQGACVNLAGKTTLTQSTAVLRQCALYVGNDSGPKHLAAASGIPVVEVSPIPIGASDCDTNSPARFGPWKVASRIVRPARPLPPCPPDGCRATVPHCIRQVSVDDVFRAVNSLLARAERSPQGPEGRRSTPS
jgi:heptosyltransferase-2